MAQSIRLFAPKCTPVDYIAVYRLHYSVKLTITQLIKSAKRLRGTWIWKCTPGQRMNFFIWGMSLGSHENTAESPTNEASPSQYHRWAYWPEKQEVLMR